VALVHTKILAALVVLVVVLVVLIAQILVDLPVQTVVLALQAKAMLVAVAEQMVSHTGRMAVAVVLALLVELQMVVLLEVAVLAFNHQSLALLHIMQVAAVVV
jgi:hypothetical protein